MERVAWRHTLPHVNSQPVGDGCMTGNSNPGSVITQRGGNGLEVGGSFKRRGRMPT